MMRIFSRFFKKKIKFCLVFFPETAYSAICGRTSHSEKRQKIWKKFRGICLEKKIGITYQCINMLYDRFGC